MISMLSALSVKNSPQTSYSIYVLGQACPKFVHLPVPRLNLASYFLLWLIKGQQQLPLEIGVPCNREVHYTVLYEQT